MSEWNHILEGYEPPLEVDDIEDDFTEDDINKWWRDNKEYCPDKENK